MKADSEETAASILLPSVKRAEQALFPYFSADPNPTAILFSPLPFTHQFHLAAILALRYITIIMSCPA